MNGRIIRSPIFVKQTKKLDRFLLVKLKKQIIKILDDPEMGKPLKYRRGERCLYVKPFRLGYAIEDNNIILLKFEHRGQVYD